MVDHCVPTPRLRHYLFRLSDNTDLYRNYPTWCLRCGAPQTCRDDRDRRAIVTAIQTILESRLWCEACQESIGCDYPHHGGRSARRARARLRRRMRLVQLRRLERRLEKARLRRRVVDCGPKKYYSTHSYVSFSERFLPCYTIKSE